MGQAYVVKSFIRLTNTINPSKNVFVITMNTNTGHNSLWSGLGQKRLILKICNASLFTSSCLLQVGWWMAFRVMSHMLCLTVTSAMCPMSSSTPAWAPVIATCLPTSSTWRDSSDCFVVPHTQAWMLHLIRNLSANPSQNHDPSTCVMP